MGITRGKLKDWRKYKRSIIEHPELKYSFNLSHFHIFLPFISLYFKVYSPDPYVTVQVLGTPNGVKRTEHVKDSSDPKWGETLHFFVDPERDRILGLH